MNVADIVILSVIGISALLSLLRGLVKEVLSLLAWVVAFWAAFRYSGLAAEHLTGIVTQAPARMALAFVGVLIGSLIAFGLLNALLNTLLQKSGLGPTDKLLGMLFGALRGLAIVLALVALADLTPLPAEPWWHASLLLPQLVALSKMLVALLRPEFAAQFGYDSSPFTG